MIDIKEYQDLNEVVFKKKLDSGLELVFVPKPGFKDSIALYTSKFGSIDSIIKKAKEEIIIPDGTAHFLEHKLFEDPGKNIQEEFQKLGLDTNAFTSLTQTSYMASGSGDFYSGLLLLIDLVENLYLTDENVDKEKGIIEEEIKMYQDMANWKVLLNCLEGLYHNHPVRKDILGTIESINTIDRSILEESYNYFYNPENMVLVVVGDLEFKKIEKVLEKSRLKPDLYKHRNLRGYIEEEASVFERFREEKMLTGRPLFTIGLKDNNIDRIKNNPLKTSLITNIILEILFNDSSMFYNECYQSGLIDSSISSYYNNDVSFGYSIIGGGSDRPIDLYDRVMGIFKKSGKEIIKIEDFKRIKNNEIGSFLMGLNSVSFIANSISNFYFTGYNLFDYIKLLDSIEYEDLIERFEEYFKEENTVLSTIIPLEEE